MRFLIATGPVLGLTFILYAAAVLIDRSACLAAWDDSGMRARYSMLAGCQVQRKDGTWVPDTAIREVSQ